MTHTASNQELLSRRQELLYLLEIPATVVNLSNFRKGQVQENIVWKNFTPSELVAIKRAMEPEVAIGQGKRTDLTCEDSAHVGEKTREVIASYMIVIEGSRTLRTRLLKARVEGSFKNDP